MYCKVLDCRFPAAHVTAGHKCGKCNEYGHGVQECMISERRDFLKVYHKCSLPLHLQCAYPDCKYKWSHTTISHHCHKCFRNHKSTSCIIKPISEYSELFPDIESVFDGENYCYIRKVMDDGSIYYIRCINREIEVLWMSSYAYDNGNELLRRFIFSCYEIKDNIKCPICRTLNDETKIYNIKGNSDKCSVCLENNVEKFFGECGHACSCNECFEHLTN